MKFPRPSSILYGNSLRVCTCRREGHGVRQVFVVFEAVSAVERDEEARRNPMVLMTACRVPRAMNMNDGCFKLEFFLLDATAGLRLDFRFRSSVNFQVPPSTSHHGWPKNILADGPLQRIARSVCVVEVISPADPRPPQVHRRILGVHRALWRDPIHILCSRHQLSFQCLFSRVCCHGRWLRALADRECSFASSVGQFVLTASLRAQVNPENRSEFKEVSPERCVLLVHRRHV